MQAIDFLDHCKTVGSWVNWVDTCDEILYGDPALEVKGVAVTWLATNTVIQRAADLNLNFIISHEGAFYPAFKEFETEKKHHQQKKDFLKRLGVTLMRCHDTWDRMPEFGIPDTWADFLGFPSEPRPTNSYYKVCHVDGLTVSEVAQQVLKKTAPLGQKQVRIMGNTKKRVSRMVVGTGAITKLPEMYNSGGDILLATDDGTHTTYCGLWSHDLDIPVLVVDHATAELPGMMKMADYIKTVFPGIRVEYLECDFPMKSIVV